MITMTILLLHILKNSKTSSISGLGVLLPVIRYLKL